MNTGIAWGLALLLCAAVQATEPPQPKKVVPPSRPSASVPQRNASAPGVTPLKLHVGDVRKYMMPSEFRDAIDAPDADRTTVVVQGERQAAPLQSTQPLAQGLPAYISLFTHPTKAWRMFLPDPNGAGTGPPDVVPKPEFRWGP
jgi:hypothetical protein